MWETFLIQTITCVFVTEWFLESTRIWSPKTSGYLVLFVSFSVFVDCNFAEDISFKIFWGSSAHSIILKLDPLDILIWTNISGPNPLGNLYLQIKLSLSPGLVLIGLFKLYGSSVVWARRVVGHTELSKALFVFQYYGCSRFQWWSLCLWVSENLNLVFS